MANVTESTQGKYYYGYYSDNGPTRHWALLALIAVAVVIIIVAICMANRKRLKRGSQPIPYTAWTTQVPFSGYNNNNHKDDEPLPLYTPNPQQQPPQQQTYNNGNYSGYNSGYNPGNNVAVNDVDVDRPPYYAENTQSSTTYQRPEGPPPQLNSKNDLSYPQPAHK